MEQKVLKRSEVNVQHTWDLSAIYATEQTFQADFEQAKQMAEAIVAKYKGKLDNPQIINQALDDYRAYYELNMRLGIFGHLSVTQDLTDDDNQRQMASLSSAFAAIAAQLSFINSEVLANDRAVIENAAQQSTENALYLQELLRFKPYALHPEAERVIEALSPVLNAPYQIYNRAKLADLDYEDFTVNGQAHPLSFNLFENVIETSRDTAVRRAAFKAFSDKLSNYNHTVAATYNTQLQREKITATLRGHDSVFDYLLFDQKVDRSLYDRQIDMIMRDLAEPMRKYARILKASNQLDKLTFADLKIAVDYDYEPEISIEGSRAYIEQGLAVMGQDYQKMLARAFDERWIDFAQNKGKSSGAFCSSPYGVHPYILISWSERMSEVFVLAHELGHAGHFYLTQQHQNIFNTRPSMYFIEAPSTMNEMLMANYLLEQKSDDLRFKRWVLATMISRTYYHNFVTHLLEAHFQREVYKIIDAGGSVQASDLNRLKLATIKQFWGDTVQVDDAAKLTWMRQPHYYMGLYPYTYSAGLTISTAVSQRIVKEGQCAIDDWQAVLKAGSTKTPVELAKMAGVDITTEQPLKETIAKISDMIDEIARITEQLEGIKLD